MTDGYLIKPGDVYKYRCSNNQGYGYMVPVKTSSGWDFIDTYQLGIPSRKTGESGDDASIRRIIELGHGEHDGYVSRATSSFYHRNARFGKTTVPCDLRLAFNLNDYEAASRRECDDYDGGDVVMFVPLYFEQHYNWDSGMALGLCFVRKGAKKSPVAEFRSLLEEASRSIVEPYAGIAAFLLGKVEEKLHELDGAGQSTQRDKDAVSRLAKRVGIIEKCTEELRAVDSERTAQLGDSGSAGDEGTRNDEND